MNQEEVCCSIALTQIQGIGPIIAKNLIGLTGSATEVFRLRNELRNYFPEVSQRIVDLLRAPEAMRRAEEELLFAEKNHIQCLTIHDPDYPARLQECTDAPVVLFYKGNARLNSSKVVSIVGTRKISAYGRELCRQFISDLKESFPDILIISGLAYGVDIEAHRQAIAGELATIGVLAHGLDRIYPGPHRQTAKEMLNKGGLVTEFISGTNPDKQNFVKRNRIIAGMSDAVVVVESASKGGSLITADIAQSYHRDCFAFPGRVTDDNSKGTNQLIKENKAALILSAEDLLYNMGWKDRKNTLSRKSGAPLLFPEFNKEEQLVVDILTQRGEMQLNTLSVVTDLPVHKLQANLFTLEMKGVIRVMAGGVYQLI